eukprot:5989053-Pyramimonas_sp.AAC.1
MCTTYKCFVYHTYADCPSWVLQHVEVYERLMVPAGSSGFPDWASEISIGVCAFPPRSSCLLLDTLYRGACARRQYFRAEPRARARRLRALRARCSELRGHEVFLLEQAHELPVPVMLHTGESHVSRRLDARRVHPERHVVEGIALHLHEGGGVGKAER